MWDKDATRANAENAMYMYMKDTILPRVCRVEQKINEKLCPMYDGDLFVAFDNPVPEDREFRLKEREVNLRTGYSSINLERQEDNLDEVEWGDIPIMAAGMVPLGSSLIGSSPATSQERMVKKKIIDRVKHYEAFVKATDPFEADWVREMQKLFAEQEREVLANMKKTPKAMVNKDVTDTWMFGRKTWEKRFADTGEKLLKAAILANGTRIMNELPVVGISFDIFNELVLDWVNGTKIDFAKEVVGTTIDKLNDAMNAGLEAGESVPDIAKRVRDVFDNATKYRSTMIARTETTASANFGTLESYRQSGVVEGKEWLATMDMRVRDSHAEMDGEVVGIDDVFSNGCSFPGDPAGGAEEAINCRCTMVPKIIEGQE
jgi:SPP1 gp7 family putative phage head morphogenesis protein